jgi:hypothetical protein
VSPSLTTLASTLIALSVAAAPTTAHAHASGVDCPLEALDTPRAEAQARQMFEAAITREESEPRLALEMLLCAQQLADKPAVALRIGTIAERTGDLKLAIRSYERYLILAGQAAPDREQMLARIAELQGRLEAVLEPEEEPKDAAADSAGAAPAHGRDSGSGQKIAGWSLTGAGVALLAGGTILLLSAKSRSDALHDIEPNTTYWSSVSGELDAARTEQTLGLVALGLGAVSSAVGVYLLSTSGDEAPVSARLAAGPGGAGGSLRLRF